MIDVYNMGENMNEKQKVLNLLCESYIGILFTMSMGGFKEFNDPSMVHRFDNIRVKLHTSIEEYFDIKYSDKDDRRTLGSIFHTLNKKIGFPIPEFEGYGVVTITRQELKDDYDELVMEFGKKLTKLLLKTFGDRQIGGRK